MELPKNLKLLAPSALKAREGQATPTLEACLRDLGRSPLPSADDSRWCQELAQGAEPLEAPHYGDVSLKRENIQELDSYLRLCRVTAQHPEQLLAYDLLIARRVIFETSALVRSQDQGGIAEDTTHWLHRGLLSIARLLQRQCAIDSLAATISFQRDKPLAACAGAHLQGQPLSDHRPVDLTSEQLLDLWRRGHWVFYVLTQGLILALRRLKEALMAVDRSEPGSASHWETARQELSSATELLWASGAAMKLTGSFRAEQYHAVVRPTMTLNHPDSQVKLTSLSGTMTWDHHFLVQQVWRKELSVVLKTVPDQLTVDYQNFVEAYQQGLSVGHTHVCSQFVGTDLGSLVQPETPAVSAIASIDEKRLNMLRAPLHALAEHAQVKVRQAPTTLSELD